MGRGAQEVAALGLVVVVVLAQVRAVGEGGGRVRVRFGDKLIPRKDPAEMVQHRQSTAIRRKDGERRMPILDLSEQAKYQKSIICTYNVVISNLSLKVIRSLDQLSSSEK